MHYTGFSQTYKSTLLDSDNCLISVVIDYFCASPHIFLVFIYILCTLFFLSPMQPKLLVEALGTFFLVLVIALT